MFRQQNRRKLPIKTRVRNLGAALKRGVATLAPLVVLAVVAVGVPFGVFEAYLHVISTPYFALDDIEITGLHNLTRHDVMHQAKLHRGANIFDVDPRTVKLRLEALPWVRHAHVQRRLPHSLDIAVEERVGAAVLVEGDDYVLLDASGEPFKTLGKSDPVDKLLKLPLITGLSRAEARTDDGQQLVVEALEVVRLAKKYHLPRLSEVHVDPVVGLSMVPAKSGIEIRLGRGRYAERMERLRAVFAAIEREGRSVDYILIDQDEKLNRVTVGSSAVERAADRRKKRN